MAKKNSKSGINVEKLNQIDKELKETMKDVKVREQETLDKDVQNMLDEYKESEMERQDAMEEYFKEQEELEKAKQEIESEIKFEKERENEMKKVLDANIKGAILFNKDKGVRGATGRQVKAIQDSYKRALGVDMTDVQIRYIRTVTDVQAQSVIYVINEYNKFIRNNQLATNC